MNPEHTAKTLQALDLLMEEISDFMTDLISHRKCFSDLMAGPGITYYRSGYWVYPETGTDSEKIAGRKLDYRWMIVHGHNLSSEIRHGDRVYECCGMEGPPPDAEFIIRCRPVAVEGKWDYDPDNGEGWRTYFLLVEEIPEKP